MTKFSIVGDRIELIDGETLNTTYIEQFTVAILNVDGTLEITGMKGEQSTIKDIDIANSSSPSDCYNTVYFITESQIIYVSTDMVVTCGYIETSNPEIAKKFREVSTVPFNSDQNVLVVQFPDTTLFYSGDHCDCKTFADLISYKQNNRVIVQRKKLPIYFKSDC